MSSEVELLRLLYARFNAREMEPVLAAMHGNVQWANGMEGGYVEGREGVRAYWTRQWAVLNPHVEPMTFSTGPTGEVVVEVHQVVHDMKGELLVDHMVNHAFHFEDGLVKRFDICG